MKTSLIDVNVNLGRWPTRRLPDDTPEALVRRLKSHDVAEAWAGSFDGLLHKDVAAVNEQLADSCREFGRNRLRPVGTVNPMLPEWAEDVRRCVDDHGMHAIRLHPNYHGYELNDSVFAELLHSAAEAGLVVQIAITMEDERMMHPLLRVPHVDAAPLLDLMPKLPAPKVILLNAFRAIRGEMLQHLVNETAVAFDIAWVEGVAGVDQIAKSIPIDRLLFGTHAPMFYYDAALLKLEESALDEQQLNAIRFENARQFIPRAR